MCYSEVLLMVCILTDVLLFVKRRSSLGWKVAEDANQKDQRSDAKGGNDGEHVVLLKGDVQFVVLGVDGQIVPLLPLLPRSQQHKRCKETDCTRNVGDCVMFANPFENHSHFLNPTRGPTK